MEVEAIQRSRRIAVLTGGEFVPITNWLDDNGEECSENEAVAAVAGPDVVGDWWTIDLRQYEPVFSH